MPRRNLLLPSVTTTRRGALRWFDVTVVPLTGLEDAAANYRSRQGALGAFFLTIPERGEDEATAQGMCRHVADQARDWDVVVGLPKEAWDISWLAKELLALEKVRDETPDLQGDRVARNEVDARIADTQGRIESGLNRAFDNAVWYRKDNEPDLLSHSELNSLASDLAAGAIPKCAPVEQRAPQQDQALQQCGCRAEGAAPANGPKRESVASRH